MNYTRYALVFLAVAVGVGTAVRLLETQISMITSATQIIVPAMIAALVEGHRFARVQREKPESAEAWGFTWTATVIALLLNIALSYAAGGFLPEFGKLAIAPIGSQQFLVLVGLYAGAYVICNRFFLGLGVSTELSRSTRGDGR